MNEILLKDIPFHIEFTDIVKRLRIDGESEDAAKLKQFVIEAQMVGRPKALYKVAYVEARGKDFVIIGGVKLTSRVLSINLEEVYRVFPFVVTCGKEIDDWSAMIDGMLEHYWADSVKGLILVAAAGFLNNHIKQTFNPGPISAMNPGSLKDWPISEQHKLFEILGDPCNSIGVELLDSCLMIPTKTISGIYFPTDTGYENCQLCPRENCQGRRASYKEALYAEKYRM